MPANRKILGQSRPSSTSDENLYSVPTNTQTVISTLTITNVSAVDATAKVYVRKEGLAASDGNKLVPDVVIAKNSFIAITIGITLSANDVITVASSAGGALTFMAFGEEII